MRAAVLHGRHDIRIEQVREPVAGPGDVLVRVDAVGICGTDAHEYAAGPHMFPVHTRHAVSGHLGPMIPGHELAGTVVASGAGVTGFPAGTRIVSGASIACGRCHWCRDGRANLCQRNCTVGLHRDGALAQYVALPASTCFDIASYRLATDVAVLAQPMSIAVHAARRSRLGPTDRAVIIGAGGIGAFLTFAASSLAAAVVVTDLDPERLRIAGDLGASRTVGPQAGRTPGEFVDECRLIPSVIYEVSGSPSGIRAALSLAPSGCRVVLVGLQGTATEVDMRDLTLREIELIGTNAHVASTDVPEALRLLASRSAGWRDVAPTALCLDDLVPEGLVPLAEGRSERIKTIVDPWAPVTRPTRG